MEEFFLFHIIIRQPDDPLLLSVVDRGFGGAVLFSAARFDFRENEDFVFSRDEIEFADRASEIAVQNEESLFAQVGGGEVFAGGAEFFNGTLKNPRPFQSPISSLTGPNDRR